jgi:hypothetical protein
MIISFTPPSSLLRGFFVTLDSLPSFRSVKVLSPRCRSGEICCIFLVFSLWWQECSLVMMSKGMVVHGVLTAEVVAVCFHCRIFGG